MDLTTTLLLVFLGISLEAFFSGSELGMVSINRIRIRQKADEGISSAKAILKMLDDPERLFTTTSLGTNLAMVSTTAVFTAYVVAHVSEMGDLLATILIFPLIFFGGEILPKLIFQHRADSLMPIMVRPLNLASKLLSPLILFFSGLSKLFTHNIMGLDKQESRTFSRDQIREVLSLDSQTVDLGVTERKMIHRIFNFGEINVEQCMVPLVHTIAIQDNANMKEAHDIANNSGYSRLPVFHERMHNLIGILNTFDLIDKPVDNSPITDLVRPAYYVPPNKKIDDLLKELQQGGLHMAIVVDEYGGCIGIITIEDLLEEIVGEIEDEYDKPEKLFESYADGGYLIDGDMEIEVINETLNLGLPKGDYETLGGLIIDKLEKIPSVGAQITLNGYRLTVKDASKRQIQSVIVLKVQAENPPEPENE
jgi:CBS domain containing-hemolysin-like protein